MLETTYHPATATAMTMASPLITCDHKIISYPHLQTIW